MFGADKLISPVAAIAEPLLAKHIDEMIDNCIREWKQDVKVIKNIKYFNNHDDKLDLYRESSELVIPFQDIILKKKNAYHNNRRNWIKNASNNKSKCCRGKK